TLIIVETAVALILVIGAALLTRSMIALRSVDLGFDSRNVLVMQMSLSGTHFERTAEINRIVRGGVEQIHALPGVSAVAASCCVPLETVWQLNYALVGESSRGMAGWTFVSPEYFDAFRIPIVRGRGFSVRDDAASPGVVIINQALARRLSQRGDPL